MQMVANQRSLTNQGHSAGCIKDLDLYGIDVAINTLHTWENNFSAQVCSGGVVGLAD